MRILGIDLGDARTGFALSDPTGFLASGLGTFHSRSQTDIISKAAEYCREYGVSRIILGLPKNMNNSLGFRAEKTIAFQEILKEMLPDIPVILWDERCSTMSAISVMNETNTRGKKRKNTIDELAAVISLQSYLDSIR
ncbi:putative pre-16S rRNA nuclease [bioreactor metagenome]|uniref:Putative pre-16S rRNA nuclease n=1 Tax=bioreactor metagenome TaxID=1076179 RepID=A0A645EA62_9ZZZZ